MFVPREKYNTQVRQRIERVIREAFAASSMESSVQIAESNLARLHIVARTSPDGKINVDADSLERRVAAAVRSWQDAFKAALLMRFDEAYALQLFDKYAQAFPAAYTEDFQADAAALDVSFLEAVEKAHPPASGYLPAGCQAQGQVLSQDLSPAGCDPDLRFDADAREHGPEGDRRAAL